MTIGTLLAALLGVWLLGTAIAPGSGGRSGRRPGHGSLVVTVAGLPRGARGSLLLVGAGARVRLSGDPREVSRPRRGHYVLIVGRVVLAQEGSGARAGAHVLPTRARIPLAVTEGHTTRVTVRYGSIVNPGVTQAPPDIVAVFGPPRDPSAVELAHGPPPHQGAILVAGPSRLLPAGLLARVDDTRPGPGNDILVTLTGVALTAAVPRLLFSGALVLKRELPEREHAEPQACKAASDFPITASIGTITLRRASASVLPLRFTIALALENAEAIELRARGSIDCSWTEAELGPYEGTLPVGDLPLPVFADASVVAGIHVRGRVDIGLLGVSDTIVAEAELGAARLRREHSHRRPPRRAAVEGSGSASARLELRAGIGSGDGLNLHAQADLGADLNWASRKGCELVLEDGGLTVGLTAPLVSHTTRVAKATRTTVWKGCRPGTKPKRWPKPVEPPQPPRPYEPVRPAPVPTPQTPDAGPTLVDETHVARALTGADLGFSDWQAATGEAAFFTRRRPVDVSRYRCVVLLANRSLGAGQRALLAAYLRSGGTVVAIGEHGGHEFRKVDRALNRLARSVGVALALAANTVDPYEQVTRTLSRSPLTAGVHTIGEDWASTVTGATPDEALVGSASGAGPIVAAARVGAGELVLAGDSNIFTDNSRGAYRADGNGRFVRDLCP